METCLIKKIEQPNNVIMNPFTANLLGIPRKKEEFILRLGSEAEEIKLALNDTVQDYEILLPSNVLKKFPLPTSCEFEAYYGDNELVIGPYLGVYAGDKDGIMFHAFSYFNEYLNNYGEMKGLIVYFNKNGIDKINNKIYGFYYNPVYKIWESGFFPIPPAIHNFRPMKRPERKFFNSFIKNTKIYNYRLLNKDTINSKLLKSETLNNYIPDTGFLNNKNDIEKFLFNYGNIYIKPIFGMKGNGIFNLKLLDNGNIKSIFIEKGIQEENEFTNVDEFLQKHDVLIEKPEMFFIQQTVGININSKQIDFRVGLDKDQSLEWKISFIGAKVSTNKIVSNRSTGASILKPQELLKDIYKFSDQEIGHILPEMERVSLAIAEELDNSGFLMAKLGVDLGVDDEGKLWVIEVNNLDPGNQMLKSLNDMDSYEQIRKSNLLYGKKIQGFLDKSKNNIVLKFDRQKEENYISFSDNNHKHYELFIFNKSKKTIEYIRSFIEYYLSSNSLPFSIQKTIGRVGIKLNLVAKSDELVKIIPKISNETTCITIEKKANEFQDSVKSEEYEIRKQKSITNKLTTTS